MKYQVKRLLTKDDEENVKNGEYSVVTRDGRVMTEVLFNYDYHGKKEMIVAYNDKDCTICDKDGHARISGAEDPDDLFIEYYEDYVEEDYVEEDSDYSLTKFYIELQSILKDFTPMKLDDAIIKHYADRILDILHINKHK